MKLFYIFSTLLLFACVANAQTTTFEIRNSDDNTLVTNGGTYYKSTTADEMEGFIYTIKNITTSSHTYNFFKTDVQINKVGPGDSALANFCTGIYCYLPDTYSAAVTLTAGEVMTLRFDLDEASAIGQSTIKYDIKNANNNETFFVTHKFNNPLGLNDKLNLQYSGIGIYPNPSHDKLYLSIKSENSQALSYTIVNTLGETVANVNTSLYAGENVLTIDSEKLESGIYYLHIEGQSKLPAQKFVVLK